MTKMKTKRKIAAKRARIVLMTMVQAMRSMMMATMVTISCLSQIKLMMPTSRTMRRQRPRTTCLMRKMAEMTPTMKKPKRLTRITK